MADRNKDTEKKIIGLMSGTSHDAIDAALVGITGSGEATKLRIIAHNEYPYPGDVREIISGIMANGASSLKQFAGFDFLMAEVFAEAALKITDEAGLTPADIDLIASHGQTVFHSPAPETIANRGIKSTLQAGRPSVIAERTGITTAGDFRSADIAAGGEGAPLVPFADFILFSDPSKGRICLNIGGIANITCLPASAKIDDVSAFDTGPGNCLLDILSFKTSDGKENFDGNGERAFRGTFDTALLDRLLAHPYFRRTPPKSTGRELFGNEFLSPLLYEFKDRNPDDLFATLALFTVKTIRGAVNDFAGTSSFSELIVSGGGCRNPFIMEHLNKELPSFDIKTSDDYGIPSAAKEAVAFAILGNETMRGMPSNVPSATGAQRPAVLGVIAPGRNNANRFWK